MKIAQVQQNNSQTFKALHLQKNISKELANKFSQMEPELSTITKDVELYFFNNNYNLTDSFIMSDKQFHSKSILHKI